MKVSVFECIHILPVLDLLYCRHEREKGEERTVKVLQNLAECLCKVNAWKWKLIKKTYVLRIFIQWKKSVYSF